MPAIFCLPKHNNKIKYFDRFFNTLGNKLIAGADYNAKHPIWCQG